jgi:hypothetical protein
VKALTRRQRWKYGGVTHWWFPYTYFLYTYIFKLGFLDGSPGFYHAYYKSWYFRCIRLLIQEQQ